MVGPDATAGWPYPPASPSSPASPGSEKAQPRTVTVKIAADSSLRTNEIWKVTITYHLRDVSQYLRDTIGVKFKITAFEYWDAEPDGRSLASLLPA